MATVTPALLEGQLAAVLAYLQTNYNAYVTAVNAKYTDGVTLTAVPAASFVESERATIPALPAVLVLGEQSRLEQEDPAFVVAQHDLAVVLVDTAAEQDALRKKMYRHALAAFACLKAGSQAASPTYKLVRWRQPYAGFSPIYTSADRQQLFMDCRVLFTCQSEEAFP